MHSREQDLATLREEYRRATKKQKTGPLNEAQKRMGLKRKVLTRMLAAPSPMKVVCRNRRRCGSP